VQLLQVNNDIRDLERKLSLLRKAIVEKDLPLKVAQTRLDERTRRMNLELTHDEPMQGSVPILLHSPLLHVLSTTTTTTTTIQDQSLFTTNLCKSQCYYHTYCYQCYRLLLAAAVLQVSKISK